MAGTKKYTDHRKAAFCNLHLADHAGCRFEGMYGMPAVPPYGGGPPKALLGFNALKCHADDGTAVHFYLDDYLFERLWRMPERYVERLKEFGTVIAPDFSQFVDAPLCVNLWNIYRNRLLSVYLANNGIGLIPSASWGNADSFGYCFDGLPQNSLIAVGSIGVSRGRHTKRLWQYGVDCLIERLSPRGLIVYGNNMAVENKCTEVFYYNDRITKLRNYV